MKQQNLFHKVLLMIGLVLVFHAPLLAQKTTGGTPPSFKAEAQLKNQIDHVQLHAPDMDQIMQEDQRDEKNGTMYKIARLLDVDLNMNNSGTWDELEDGTRIWRLKISIPGAKALSLHYESIHIPYGGKLFVYNEARDHVHGAYTHKFNRDVAFSTSITVDATCILEYVAPNFEKNKMKRINTKPAYDPANDTPVIDIFRVGYIYRGVDNLIAQVRDTKDYGDAESCHININCTQGNSWQDEKRGVARIYIIDGYTAGLCTGSLVNNTNNDGSPYFLTADHCGGDVSASDMNQWQFTFNFESPTCTNQNPGDDDKIYGATKRAVGGIEGGSDFLLLELSSTPSSAFEVYYNGWNRNTSYSSSGAGIHHPVGDIKKISIYSSPLSTTSWSGAMTNAHWGVQWSDGVTEGGSSGSPLFDSDGYIVGTLTGGGSSCTNPSYPDYYGKFDNHWDDNGSSNDEMLEPWLDPASTGATTLPGYDPNNAGVNADFFASPTTVAPGGSVQFTDNSSGTPSSWSWTFDGGSPSTSSSENPSVTYNTEGTYDVTLTVSSGDDSDTETKYGYITVQEGSSGFSMDFEACTDFQVDDVDPWTTYDGDATPTYGMESYDYDNENYTGAIMCFNPSQTTPAMTDFSAHGGQKCGAFFASIPGEGSSNDDWLISPAIALEDNSSFSFWGKSYTDQYGLERFRVLVSTTNNSPGSFSAISSEPYVEASTTWSEYSYDLSAYDNQTIYVAINCVSDDAFIFFIDDLEISTESGSTGDAPVADFTGSPTTVSTGGTVNFTDQSSNSPTSWSWTFEGGSPSTSSSENPSVTYNTAGTYDVTLVATNSEGSNTEVKNDYITVSSDPGECEELHYPLNGTETLYTAQEGGYVCGGNGYGDEAKADFFDYSGAGEVTQLTIHIGAVDGTNGNIDFHVWEDGGSQPGSILGTKAVSMSTLSGAFTDVGDPYVVEFDSPIQISGNFYAGFSGIESADYFSVTSTTDGDGANTAWEQWDGGAWYAFDDDNGWGLSLTQAIFPEVCPLVGISEDIESALSIYPNPSTGTVQVESADGNMIQQISVYNIMGQKIQELRDINAIRTSLHLEDAAEGMYSILIETAEGSARKTLTIQR